MLSKNLKKIKDCMICISLAILAAVPIVSSLLLKVMNINPVNILPGLLS